MTSRHARRTSEVSVAVLKSRLSHFLGLVKKGIEVVVVSHRHPIGKLVPYSSETPMEMICPSRSAHSIKQLRGVSLLHPVNIDALLKADREKR